ncbi:hypothetical protein CLV65_0551 [Pseudoscardovia suis]|uniref:Uncharacterized protein n=1 Tax=Pseudoscardovia suis TaxID=987063 RepID=A0A261ES80_9BIFI|nr:hypothetical protein PSSU_1538 [Pseudoscardovia suis]PJJ69833.1 hypothetical protein CLV65_0551 [Pseudoscardovia suis]
MMEVRRGWISLLTSIFGESGIGRRRWRFGVLFSGL